MKFTWRSELPALLILALMLGLAAWAWPTTPDRVPVHWGIDGTPDRWGTRVEGLLIFPSVALIFYVMFLVLPRIDPGRANYAKFAGAFFTFRLGLMGFVAALEAATIAVYRGTHLDIRMMTMPLVGALLIIIGTLLGRIEPNWFIGVRTPWTLSSRTSWVRSNRAGGWVLIGSGVLFVLAGALQRSWAMIGAIVALAAGVLGVVVYSYVVWKNAPDKVPPAGSTPAAHG